jgi:hypothetical protein
MSKIRVDLQSVKVTEGQGVGEGDFELRVTVAEGKNTQVWPSANGSVKVEKGVVRNINEPVATYNVESGTLSKLFTVDVTEVDKGTLGQDDEGGGTVTLEMTPTMAPLSRTVTIPLKRPDMKFLGKVNVTLSAQRVA